MDTKYIELKEIMPIIKEKLSNGGNVIFTPRGTSMLPLLRDGKDTVTLAPITSPLKKLDLVLFQRENGHFVLHRIVKIKNDLYTFRGDNQFINEKGIKKEQIIAKVISIKKENKITNINDKKYRLYCHFWMFSYPFRFIYRKFKSKLASLVRKKTRD